MSAALLPLQLLKKCLGDLISSTMSIDHVEIVITEEHIYFNFLKLSSIAFIDSLTTASNFLGKNSFDLQSSQHLINS